MMARLVAQIAVAEYTPPLKPENLEKDRRTSDRMNAANNSEENIVIIVT